MATTRGDAGLDRSLAFLREGYDFIGRRTRRYASDVVEARLLLRRTLLLSGADAARVFYDPRRFVRHGAAPRRVRKTLFGEGGVQSLDGEAHRVRKGLFTALLTPEAARRIADLAAAEWRRRAALWEGAGDPVVLHDQAREIHCVAICAWAGVPLPRGGAGKLAARLGALVDTPAALGPVHLKGRLARWRAERWAGRLVDDARRGIRAARTGSALQAVTEHRDHDGALLDRRTAAVELLNILRPVVAVARFTVFAALALHEHPEWRDPLRTGDPADVEYFVQEVRRLCPFFPAVPARVRDDFEWRGHRFPAGCPVLLDLYGTDHDPRLWDRPDEFRPDRFRGRDIGAFELIPQGGGDVERGHRCPGEWTTIELLKVAVQVLAAELDYSVPEQDLSVRLDEIPALPASGFVVTGVRATATGATR
jgi:fatty-acid peroxygenase